MTPDLIAQRFGRREAMANARPQPVIDTFGPQGPEGAAK